MGCFDGLEKGYDAHLGGGLEMVGLVLGEALGAEREEAAD